MLRLNSRPEWNCKMTFNMRYPPLVWLIKIELCNALNGVGTGADEVVLATEYINLREVSNFCTDDPTFLPTFGPQHVDFYSKPNNLRIQKTNVSETGDPIEVLCLFSVCFCFLETNAL